jgi:HSP20 family protein
MSDNDYVHREVSWGSFSRTISLPAEVEVEEADASERHGILTIRLPKIDKERQTKLQVKRTQ